MQLGIDHKTQQYLLISRYFIGQSVIAKLFGKNYYKFFIIILKQARACNNNNKIQSVTIDSTDEK